MIPKYVNIRIGSAGGIRGGENFRTSSYQPRDLNTINRTPTFSLGLKQLEIRLLGMRLLTRVVVTYW